MASQAAIFAETIAGMKKAVKRKDYDSDSDDSIEELTNRGNKLKRKSRFVREGQLAPPSGPQVYRKSVEAEDDVNLFFDEREKIRAHIGKLVAKDDADQASTGTLVSEEAENVGLLESVAHATQTALETLKEPNAINNGLSASDAARGQVAKVTHPSVDQVNGSGESTKPKSPPIPSQAMEDRGETGYGETNETVDEVMDMEVAVKEAVAQIEGNEIRPVEEVGDVDVDAGTGDTEEVPAPRRMRTRAQAQAASDNTASSRTRKKFVAAPRGYTRGC
ncbi:hypothetical protein M7I_7399 [Glarea lozoyensis 74030]|uniref:Transcriptional regulatory protein RXT2 N-terminal domain-containing protein n=1 Tax=Glarea lozoyensis (strain ATCC 74030 / MF5533) TaxID=1104152 RepID=H0EX72_GLAL7|nr:hypothetical protein M7I_7399 [Glarea lozoyensis 74030]